MFHELILLRHAKSAWPVGVRDSQRPLSARGVRSAIRFGEALASRGTKPQTVVISPAERTRATWELVAEHGRIDPGLAVVDPRVYAATWWDVLDVVRELPSDCERALIVGHNPAMEDLAGQLAGPDSEKWAVKDLRTKFPTCAAAYLSSERDWDRWGGQCADLTQLWKPR